MNKDEILTKWAEKTTYSKEELDTLLKEIYAEERKNFPDESEEEAKSRAIALLRAKLKKEFLGGTTKKRFWIIAADRLSDFTGRRYQSAKEAFAKNPEEAVNTGLTDTEGTPLYPKTDKYRAGQPMPEHDYQRTIYGYHPVTGMYNIAVRGASARDFDMSLVGKLVEMPIWINKNKSEDNNTVGSFNKRLAAIQVVEATDEDGKPMPVEELFPVIETREKFKETAGTYQPVLLRGIVLESRETSDISKSNIVSLDPGFPDGDLEEIITCWVDPALPLNFADTSEVIVLGTTSSSTDDEGKEQLSMNVFGIYDTDRTIRETPQPISPPAEKKIEEDDDNVW